MSNPTTRARTNPAVLIRSQVVLEEHDVAADGRFAVVVRRFVQGDRYRSHLWLIPLSGKVRPVQLTSGRVRDTYPRIAPDGSAVAFKRSAAATRRPSSNTASDDETPRLFVLPLATDGRSRRPWSIRTPRERAVGEIAWAPDGRRLALTLDVDPPRFLVGPEPAGDDTPLARVIRRIDWRYDESGHVDRWSHLHVVEARRGVRPQQVTAGEWSVADIAWSPDGARIAFTADPREDADIAPRPSIWIVAAAATPVGEGVLRSDEPREVLRLGGWAYKAAWSPDSRWLAAIGYVDADARDDTSPEVVVGPADGSQPAWPLAPTLDRPVGAWYDTDLEGWTASSRVTPCWADAGTIVAVVSDRGRARPWAYRVDPSTGRPLGDPVPLAAGDVITHSLAVASDPSARPATRVTLLACLGDRPLELVTVALDPAGRGDPDAEPARPMPRTRMGSRWADRLQWPDMRMLEAPGAGGPIEMWVASPADAVDGPLPAVVDIHGGPLGAWGPAPSIEHVLLCARGYRLILPNIRGSTGYGRDWIRPQLNDWGGVDATDVHSAIDHAVALGLVDPDRLGVMGFSYGGFMVNWLVATSNRFRAGVSEAGVTNQVSAFAGGDTSVEFNKMALLPTPLDPDGVAGLWRQSPLAHVANVQTPLLLLQGEADQRCPPSDAEQLFVALRVLGRTVEYVLYPEESHVYMASGRPDRRIDRMQRVLGWFDRYLLQDTMADARMTREPQPPGSASNPRSVPPPSRSRSSGARSRE